MRKASKKTLKAKADKLFSLHIRSYGKCMAENWPGKEKPCNGPLQCAHRKSRRFLVTRWDERNADCLCAACHRFFHDHPNLHKEFVDWVDPEAWDYLNRLIFQSGLTVTAEDAIEMYGEKK